MSDGNLDPRVRAYFDLGSRDFRSRQERDRFQQELDRFQQELDRFRQERDLSRQELQTELKSILQQNQQSAEDFLDRLRQERDRSRQEREGPFPAEINPPKKRKREEDTNATTASSPRIKECAICMSKPVQRIFIPCGHPCLCDDCSTDQVLERLRRQGGCPECRKPFEQSAKFYGKVLMDD